MPPCILPIRYQIQVTQSPWSLTVSRRVFPDWAQIKIVEQQRASEDYKVGRFELHAQQHWRLNPRLEKAGRSLKRRAKLKFILYLGGKIVATRLTRYSVVLKPQASTMRTTRSMKGIEGVEGRGQCVPKPLIARRPRSASLKCWVILSPWLRDSSHFCFVGHLTRQVECASQFTPKTVNVAHQIRHFGNPLGMQKDWSCSLACCRKGTLPERRICLNAEFQIDSWTWWWTLQPMAADSLKQYSCSPKSLAAFKE